MRAGESDQTSAGLSASSEIEWSSRIRTTLGVRGDAYRWTVASNNPLNTGDHSAGIVSPKVSAFARADGGEFGVRTVAIRGLQTTATVWYLAFDSELIYVGDSGSTEEGPATRRYGLEITNYVHPTTWRAGARRGSSLPRRDSPVRTCSASGVVLSDALYSRHAYCSLISS